MSDEFGFFLLLLSNGVLIGLMYSLIALGFVLVYKATDAVNFAQGEFVLLGTRQRVTPQQLDLGRDAWLAFISPDPTQLERLAHGDTSALSGRIPFDAERSA